MTIGGQEPNKSQKPNDPNDKEKDSFQNIMDYAKSNTRDVVAYVLMIIGIILLFFQPVYGGLIIGVVAGVYFSKEIIQIIKELDRVVDQQGLVRSLIFGGTLLAFFISAPAIFVGAAVVIGLRYFLMNE